MYKLSGLTTDVEIDLDNGVYTFDGDSATGKTFLLKTLIEYLLDKKPVIGFTYTDFIKGISLDDIFSKKHYDVVMFDRYDMYFNQFEDLIEKLGKESIVLIDSKEVPDFKEEPKACLIFLEKGKIQVF